MNDQQIAALLNAAPSQTKQFITELLAITANLPYGYLEPKIEIHSNSVVSAEFQGWQKLRFHNDNHQALSTIIQRYNDMIKNKETNRIVSIVAMQNGVIREVFFRNRIVRRYDADKNDLTR